MLIGGWWPRLRAACDPPLPFVLSSSLVGVPLVGTQGQGLPRQRRHCGARASPACETRSRRGCRRGSRLALSFVVSRARVFGGPCRTTLRIQQPTPPPSRRPRPGPSSNQATPAQPANPISLHTQPSIPPLSPSSPSSLTTYYSPLTPRHLAVSLPKWPVRAATQTNPR